MEMARLFASSAGGTLGLVQRVGQLQQAAESQQKIGKAVGIVMERYQIDQDRAFGILVRLSQNTNRKVRLVAEEIVDGLDSRTRPYKANSSDVGKRADMTRAERPKTGA
jgi:hypothetical protein